MKKQTENILFMLLVFVVAVLWMYLLVHHIRVDTRQEFVLDNDTGRPVEIWRYGK